MFLIGGCSFNSGRIRLLNYDVATSLFGNVPDEIAVAKGDTLYSISRRYDVPLRDLITVNSLTPPYTLAVGQLLKIPSARYHIVSKGDTLYNVSKRYNVDITTLSRLNNIEAPYTLSIGQKLMLPGTTGTAYVYEESSEDETGTVWLAPKASSVPASSRTLLKTSAPAKKTVSVKKSSSSKKTVQKKTSAKKVSSVRKTTKTSSRATVVKSRKTKFAWPVKGKIISKFGTIGKGRNNDGINIRAPRGTSVKAADKGVVVYAGNELKGFGNLILVKHSGGWITAYAHNQKLLVKKGQKVVKGEKIATVGNTGGVSEPQLHFEIRAGKKPVNPVTYLP